MRIATPQHAGQKQFYCDSDLFPFSLRDGESRILKMKKAKRDGEDIIEVVERPMEDWELVGVECEDNADVIPIERGVRIAISSGEHITCTFLNDFCGQVEPVGGVTVPLSVFNVSMPGVGLAALLFLAALGIALIRLKRP